MKCEEIQEYLSALCDGERIPPEAAEHIGVCEACQARMNEYLRIGVELRRLASVESTREMELGAWKHSPQETSGWWAKGWETIRIPRFAFVSLLVLVVALGSGLVLSRVRADTHGTVLLLTYKLPDGRIERCALSLVDEGKNLCATIPSPNSILLMKTLSQNGDRIELGVHAQYKSLDPQIPINILDELKNIQEKRYWITPGQELRVDIPSGEKWFWQANSWITCHRRLFWIPTSNWILSQASCSSSLPS